MSTTGLPPKAGSLPSGRSESEQRGSDAKDKKKVENELSPFLMGLVRELEISLKRRKVIGSSKCAIKTLELLQSIVSKARITTFSALIRKIREIGRRVADANRTQLTVGNSVRRVLHIVRQIVAEHQQQGARRASMSPASPRAGDAKIDPLPTMELPETNRTLSKIMDSDDKADLTRIPLTPSLKQRLIDEISELISDVRNVYMNIKEYSVEHVHAREVILTSGYSTTVRHFLTEASKLDREFEVIVAESAPSYDGHRMAKELAKAGIETTVITDSAVFAMMNVVNKVILGAFAVLANGGLIARSGSHSVAAAAKYHSVPFVCVTGLYKLSPLYSFDQDTFNEFKYPGEIVKFEEEFVGKIKVQNPGHDYIPPSLVSLFVTNFGGNSPSYIYRLLAQNYDSEDYDL